MARLREHLRCATADIHEALHGAEPFARIARGAISRGDYGALLQTLHRYHSEMAGACETGAVALDAPVLAESHRGRIARLAEDMAFLDVTPATGSTLQPASDNAFAIGCLYTVLGSTLGGKVISRQLEVMLPDGRGRRFFSGGPQDAVHWRLFCDRLEEWDGPVEPVEAGARHAFARFAARMEDWPQAAPQTITMRA